MNFSYWESQFFLAKANLVVIGGGISGLSAAYHAHVKNPNWEIIVLEQFPNGNAASTRNAGFACFGSAGELVDDLKCGSSKEAVFQLAETRYKGLELLLKTLGEKNVDYHPCGSLELFTKEQSEEFEEVQDVLDELNKELNLSGAKQKIFSTSEVPLDLTDYSQAIENHLEGKLNPGLMIKAWKELCVESGIIIYKGEKAVIQDEGKVVKFGSHSIKTDQVAVCTNGLSSSLGMDLDVTPARNLVLLTKPLPDLKLDATYHHLKGYYYFRKIHERLLLGGGRHLFKAEEETEEFSVNQQLKAHLVNYLEKHFHLRESDLEMEWTGILGVSEDKTPIIKRINSNICCGVKLGGMGVAIGTLVGKEVAELL